MPSCDNHANDFDPSEGAAGSENAAANPTRHFSLLVQRIPQVIFLKKLVRFHVGESEEAAEQRFRRAKSNKRKQKRRSRSPSLG